jgi:SAM-dependent methyltransferase
LEPKDRFLTGGDVYAKARPSYPIALIDWILERAPGKRVVDLGCGTGIASRLFAARGCDVTGVDPSEDMLRQARAAGGGVSYVRGEAETTGLPGGSFDVAIAAQAFHWFDAPRAITEIARLVRTGGVAAAFWNMRTGETPFLEAYERVLRAHSSDYDHRPVRDDGRSRLRAVVASLEEASFPWHWRIDREHLIEYAHSASYVRHGVSDLSAFDRALDQIFTAHAVDGQVTIDYDAACLLWRP